MRRIACCVLLSIVAHLGALWQTGPAPSTHRLISPLRLELRHVIPDVESPPARSVPSLETAQTRHSTMDSPQTILPSTPDQPVPDRKALNLPPERYYASSEVDIRAEPLNEVDLIYPQIPYQQRLGGVVRVYVFVNERGGLDRAEVAEATPVGIFEEAALQAIQALKFSPAIKDGKPVKNRKTIELNFDPYEKINTP